MAVALGGPVATATLSRLSMIRSTLFRSLSAILGAFVIASGHVKLLQPDVDRACSLVGAASAASRFHLYG